MIYKLFKIGEDVDGVISYYDGNDRSGDWISLSSDEELRTAVRYLGEEETWQLQVMVDHPKDHPARQEHHAVVPRATPVWDWTRWDPRPPSHHHVDELFGFEQLDPLTLRRKQHQGGEAAEKPLKVVYRHFGSWEPKVEKGDNYVVTTYGLVGYEIRYIQEETRRDET